MQQMSAASRDIDLKNSDEAVIVREMATLCQRLIFAFSLSVCRVFFPHAQIWTSSWRLTRLRGGGCRL
jgi:hypothetical protein